MNEKEWYEDENLITSILIGLLILIIIISQSYAIRQQLGLGFMLRSLLNNNSIHLIFLTYLILIKTKFGKRNFNLSNIVLIIIELVVFLLLLFKLFQGLCSSINLVLNAVLLCYMVYTLLKGTSIWSSLHLDKIPFSEFTNDNYYLAIILLVILSLIINVFNNVSFNGIILSLFEAMFTIGFARYLYLWKDYQSKKEQINLEKARNQAEKIDRKKVKSPKTKKDEEK